MLPRLLVVVTTLPPARVPLVPEEVPFVPEPPPMVEVPFVPLPPVVPLLLLLLPPVAAAAPVVVVYVEPWLSVVVMTPATAPPALDAPAETAVVPVRTVCATVVEGEPLAAAAATSVGIVLLAREWPVGVLMERNWCWGGEGGGNEPEQKLLPTEMIWVGSTGGLAAAQTTVEQSRTPKPKFMLRQRHW